MNKNDAKKSLECVVNLLKEDEESRRIIENVLHEYFTPRKTKCRPAAFKEEVIKTILKPYRRKQPIIEQNRRWIDPTNLKYMYTVKGNKMGITDTKTIFYFTGQEIEGIEDGYYNRKGELLRTLGGTLQNIWEEGFNLSRFEQLIDDTGNYLESSQVVNLVNQNVIEDDKHRFSITLEDVKVNFGIESNTFKLIRQLLTCPGTLVSIHDRKMIIKSNGVKVITLLQDLYTES